MKPETLEIGFSGKCDVVRAKTSTRFELACVIAPVHITLSLPCGEQKRQNPRRVKCWAATLAILAVLSAALALAEDFKTINGKLYKDATISRVEAGSCLEPKREFLRSISLNSLKTFRNGFITILRRPSQHSASESRST
jgi:hypothetical protein